MSDPEYDTAVHYAATLGLTARTGPSYAEFKSFPWWKRLAVRLTPTRQRWRYSEFAPLVREFINNRPR